MSKTLARMTKSELMDEIKRIRTEHKEASKSVGSTQAKMNKAEEGRVRATTKGLSLDSILKDSSALIINLDKTFNQLNETVQTEFKKLSDIKAAIEIAEKDLKNIHDIEVAQVAISQLIEEYDKKREELEAEVNELEANYKAKVEALEAEEKERLKDLNEKHAREIEKYRYDRDLGRRNEEDEYSHKRKIIERQNEEADARLKEGWRIREEELSAKEEKVKEMQAIIDNMPETIQNERDLAAKEAKDKANKSAAIEYSMKKKDYENSISLLEQRNKSLEDKITELYETVETLREELRTKSAQIENITIRSIEGASGKTAFDAVKDIADKQASGSGKK